MVGTIGFEPMTPAMSRQYSTTELRTQINYNFIILKLKKIYTNYSVLKKSLFFRKFKSQDTKQVLEIYNYYIVNSLANFEEKRFTYLNFLKLSKKILNLNLPFIISKLDKKIVGFAYLDKFRNKSGYKFSCENSIYVHKDYVSKGIGSALLKELLKVSYNKKEIKTIIAVIGVNKSKASIQIHKKNGFKKVGILKNVGFKNNQWIDTIYMQKNINEKN